MSDRVFLSYEDAVALLPDGDYIHTMTNPGMNMIVGCDWQRADVLQLLKTGKPELAGRMASGMGHGIVCFRKVHDNGDLSDPIYIKTNQQDTDV